MRRSGQQIKQITRSLLLLILLVGFTTSLSAATYTVNYASDTANPPYPPLGDINLRTALQAANAGDTVNFSTTPPGSSTDMNGQTTTLGSSILLNSTGAGAPITLDLTGLTSGSPTGFTVDGNSNYGISYTGTGTVALAVSGNGFLNFVNNSSFSGGLLLT